MSATYRRTSPMFWQDPKVRDWDDAQKLLGQYLLTSPHRATEGLYWLPRAYIAEDMAWEASKVGVNLQRLIDDGFCAYDDRTQTVLICKALKYQAPKGHNALQGAINTLADLPPTPLIAGLVAAARCFAPELAAAVEQEIRAGSLSHLASFLGGTDPTPEPPAPTDPTPRDSDDTAPPETPGPAPADTPESRSRRLRDAAKIIAAHRPGIDAKSDRYRERVIEGVFTDHRDAAWAMLLKEPTLTAEQLAARLDPAVAGALITHARPVPRTHCDRCGGATMVETDDGNAAHPCPDCNPHGDTGPDATVIPLARAVQR